MLCVALVPLAIALSALGIMPSDYPLMSAYFSEQSKTTEIMAIRATTFDNGSSE